MGMIIIRATFRFFHFLEFAGPLDAIGCLDQVADLLLGLADRAARVAVSASLNLMAIMRSPCSRAIVEAPKRMNEPRGSGRP